MKKLNILSQYDLEIYMLIEHSKEFHVPLIFEAQELSGRIGL